MNDFGLSDLGLCFWQNGLKMQKYEASGGSFEVTAILPVANQKSVLTMGWNRLISCYQDKPEVLALHRCSFQSTTSPAVTVFSLERNYSPWNMDGKRATQGRYLGCGLLLSAYLGHRKPWWRDHCLAHENAANTRTIPSQCPPIAVQFSRLSGLSFTILINFFVVLQQW